MSDYEIQPRSDASSYCHGMMSPRSVSWNPSLLGKPCSATRTAGWHASKRRRVRAARVFNLPKAWRAAEMFREDLAADEIATTDSEGNVADFHALRHTFASLLSRGGVVPRVAQALLRHSDPRLTLVIYTHLGADDERGALDLLTSRRRMPTTRCAPLEPMTCLGVLLGVSSVGTKQRMAL